MNGPGIESRFAKRGLDWSVIDAGHFDCGDRVRDLEFFERGFDLLVHSVKRSAPVFDGGRFDENLTVKITDHPRRANLGTIDRDDGKVFRASLLDSRLNDTGRLADVPRAGCLSGFSRPFLSGGGHVRVPRLKGKENPSMRVLSEHQSGFLVNFGTYQA